MSDNENAPEQESKSQVPVRTRFLWGIGGMTDTLTYNGLNGMMDAIFVNAMGINPLYIGQARSWPRLFDLLTDPLLGHLSDNTRSRWGRRRPWMAVGALVAAAVAVLMWYPPLGASPLLVRTFVVSMMVILFTLGYSMFTIPYTAQGYELSTDYNERTHIFQWRQYAMAATGFLTPWFIPLCLWFEGADADVTKGKFGVHYVSWIIAGAILLTACAPIFGCRETGRHTAEKKTRLAQAFRLTLRNKAFWPLVLGNFLVKFGMVVTGCFFYYVMVYSVSAGNNVRGTTRLAIFFNTINVSTFLAMAPMVRLTDRLDKKRTLLVLMLLSSAAYASVWFTLRPHHAPTVLAVTSFLAGTLHLWQPIADIWPALFTGAAIGVFCNSMPLIMNSMLADVCDEDELVCGQQRQAFYGGMFVTCDKLAMALAMYLQGWLVATSGYQHTLVQQAPETIAFWMRALLVTQPTGFLLGFALVLLYPITRARARATRAALDARKVAADR